MAYCEEDYFNLFAMKCAGCKQGLIGEYVSACGKEYHPGCFVCMVSFGLSGGGLKCDGVIVMWTRMNHGMCQKAACKLLCLCAISHKTPD